MLSGSPGQGRVAGWKEDKMVHVGARKAQGAFLSGQRDPRAGAESLAAFATDRFTTRDKYFEFFVLFSLGSYSAPHFSALTVRPTTVACIYLDR